jgi:DNA-binding beta-propeller fold protein YncE
MISPRYALIALALTLTLIVGCSPEQETSRPGTTAETTSQAKYDPPAQLPPAPEPAESPAPEEEPAGRTIDLGGKPEGLVADPETGLLAAGLRNPDRLALIDGDNGETVRSVDLPESPRHLALAAPGGPVLVPMERADELVQVGLPQGEILSTTPVGAFPHDAAAAPNGRIFVLNEMESTVSVIEDGEVIETLATLRQPGGVAATPDGRVGVIGVRGLGLEVFDAESLESLGRIDAGEGPTHVVAGPDNRFYVSDTRGDAVLVYEAGPELEQVARLPLEGGSPYGISIDPERSQLWVTMTAENTVVQYDIKGEPEELNRYPTVRQPNSVAVDPASGRVFVAGKVESQLQILEP